MIHVFGFGFARDKGKKNSEIVSFEIYEDSKITSNKTEILGLYDPNENDFRFDN